MGAEPRSAITARRAVARVVLVTLALLVAGELGARLWLTSPSGQLHDAELGWTWRPGAEVFNGSEGGARIQINGLGMNDAEVGVVPPGRRRVLVLGNSFTEALQVPASANFTSVLESLETDLDVVNAARSAMGPAHYPILAGRHAPPLAPDVILVAVGAGDVDHVMGPTTAVSRRPGAAIDAVRPVAEGKDALKASFEPLLARSALATYLMRRYKQAILDWADAARGLTGQPAVAASPAQAGAQHDLGDATARIAWVLRDLAAHARVVVVDIPELDYRPRRAAVPAAPAVTGVYRRACEASGARYVDAGAELVAAYERTGHPGHGFHDVQLGFGHLNEAGHRAVARALAPALREALSP